ncbi:phosphoribosylglycinamide formyltransferase [soil metagenome]
MTNIAIFASGAGSNAQTIIDSFKDNKEAVVALVVSNKAEAGVLHIAETADIPFAIIDKDEFKDEEVMGALLEYHKIDWIVLAGFLWLIPSYLVSAYPNKIINIHPALLPAHGGKGMYGNKVHEAVKTAGDTESGITVHYVNEHFDEGEIIFQARCPITPTDTPDDIRKKVQALEHEHYPLIIAGLLKK